MCLLLVLVVLHGVVALSSQDEIGRDELRALMEQLVEGVLSVCGGLAEQDWAGRVLYIIAAASDRLAVRLHGKLLKVGREPVQVLIKAKYRQSTFSLGTTIEHTERPDASAHRRSLSTRHLANRR